MIIVQSLLSIFNLCLFLLATFATIYTLCPSRVYPLVLCREAFYLITARLYLCIISKL
jgi:hypothetical protein